MNRPSQHNSPISIASSTGLVAQAPKFVPGLMLLSLLLFVASCAVTPQVVVETKYVSPPKALTQRTPVPEPRIADAASNGALLTSCLAVEAALTMCNADKVRIEQYEPSPSPEKPAAEPTSWFKRLFSGKNKRNFSRR